MGRLTVKPISVPDAVTFDASQGMLRVKGPKGELARPLHPSVQFDIDAATKTLRARLTVLSKEGESMLGTTLVHARNMMQGVTEGFSKTLQLEGVGYRAVVEGDTLVLSLGFSHPVRFSPPAGVTIRVEKNEIILEGANKELVGQAAASIRAFREPEPYKGKGIRYKGEHVKRKAGKKAGAGA